ncbi:MAG: cytoplasmic protein [Deltaproteobacteria bacterium]|jgi:hypothetical protein|nr:cytoplasmic protein [Deltaproteobacteria bacterium]
MFVGAARVELMVHGSQSLKQKRGVVKSIMQRTRNRFNVSIAEVGGQDTWQIAVLGLTTAANESGIARQRLEKAIDFIDGLHLAEILDQEVEVH